MANPKRSAFNRLYPRVNTRITAPFLLITIVIAALGVFIVTRLVASSIDERLSNQLISSAQAAINTTVEQETEILAVLRSMVFTEGIIEATQSNNSARIASLLSPIVVNNRVDTIVVFGVRGQILYSAGYDIFANRIIENPVTDSTTIAGIERVLNGTVDVLGDKFVDIVADRGGYRLYLSAPLVSGNVIQGGISIAIDSTQLVRRLTEQSLAGIILYDREGVIFGNSFRLADQANFFIPPEEFEAILLETTEQNPLITITISDIPYRIMYTPLIIRSDTVGVLAIALPTDFVIEQISISRNVFAVVFVGLFLVVAVIGIVVTQSIIRPINQLVDTTRAIQDGDLTRRVNLKMPDEIGELSRSFDQMTDRLVQRNEEISNLYVEQLEETARRDAILSSITDIVLVKRIDDDVVLLNPAGQRLVQQIQHDNRAYHEFFRLQSSPERLYRPITVTLGDQHFSVIATSVHTEENKHIGHIVVFRDITALVAAEHLKDEMILQLSHELRTPLSSARGYVELLNILGGAKLDAQSQEFLHKSVEQLAILERMVNQVVDVSAILANDLSIAFERMNISELVREIATEMNPLTTQKNQRLKVSLPPYDLWIEGDAYHLRQVCEHILQNSINFTPEYGNIEISVEGKKNSVELFVIDNGVGIDFDEQEHVFERMYRGRATEAGEMDTRGLGLGLYLSKTVVEAHHGVITLDSQKDKGTIITITLPAIQRKVNHERTH